jgi:lipopolysaccharide transport system ATP-binding protein
VSDVVIQVTGLSKQYRLGEVSTRVLAYDLNRWWSRIRGKPDPYARIKSDTVSGSSSLSNEMWALRDVNFEVSKGEVLGIIGRNGAGKSTLLKILSRVTAPTRGAVRLKGKMASLLEVGTGFHPDLTGRENIFLNGAILGMTRRDILQHFEEIVEFSGCGAYIDTPVKRYSSGMYVRLAFAVAAHLNTDILIVDEVLAVGDMDFQKKCLGRMGEVAREGKTVLIVSHNMASISNLCSRAVLVKEGSIAADGAVKEVISKYLQSGTDQGGLFKPPPGEEPGNSKVRLLAVELTQDDLPGPSPDMDISKDIIIRITYKCLEDRLPLYAGIWLKDGMGTVLLCSGNSPDANSVTDPWYGRPHPVGVYCSEMRIHGNFLNYGRFSLTPIVGIVPSNTQILLEDQLTFDVHDTGSMRKTFFGHRLGVIYTPFPWMTRSVERASSSPFAISNPMF